MAAGIVPAVTRRDRLFHDRTMLTTPPWQIAGSLSEATLGNLLSTGPRASMHADVEASARHQVFAELNLKP